MAVGHQVTKAGVDATALSVLNQLDTALARAERYKKWLDTVPNADLTAAGFSEAEVAYLKSAFGEADALRATYAENQFIKVVIGPGSV